MGSTDSYQFVELGQHYSSAVEALLQQCNLPFEDCAEHLGNFIGVLNQERLIALGGVQFEGSYALLRSLAVLAEFRAQGLAGKIVERLLDNLKHRGNREVYLITTTADAYFARRGFYPVARATLPFEIQATEQFSRLCPSDAQAMRLDL